MKLQLFVTLQSVACQAPLSIGFSRILSGLPCPPPKTLYIHLKVVKRVDLMLSVLTKIK